jgi:hypothetical protein
MSSDLELATAYRDLVEFDRVIDELYSKFPGKELDEGKNEFEEADKRRETALQTLATIPAKSPEGMIAKAKALKAASIVEDYDRQAAIAMSLADDVLRYFSGAA